MTGKVLWGGGLPVRKPERWPTPFPARGGSNAVLSHPIPGSRPRPAPETAHSPAQRLGEDPGWRHGDPVPRAQIPISRTAPRPTGRSPGSQLENAAGPDRSNPWPLRDAAQHTGRTAERRLAKISAVVEIQIPDNALLCSTYPPETGQALSRRRIAACHWPTSCRTMAFCAPAAPRPPWWREAGLCHVDRPHQAAHRDAARCQQGKPVGLHRLKSRRHDAPMGCSNKDQPAAALVSP